MLLNIDHVINSIDLGDEEKHPIWLKEDFHNSMAGKYCVVWSKKVIEQLSDWHHSERIDIRWLTSWGLRANKFFAPAVKLPQFRYGFDAEPLKRNWKESRPDKVSSFIAFYEAQVKKDKEKRNKIIWVDDEIIYYLGYIAKSIVFFKTKKVLAVLPHE
jgi:hypothetical protein